MHRLQPVQSNHAPNASEREAADLRGLAPHPLERRKPAEEEAAHRGEHAIKPIHEAASEDPEALGQGDVHVPVVRHHVANEQKNFNPSRKRIGLKPTTVPR